MDNMVQTDGEKVMPSKVRDYALNNHYWIPTIPMTFTPNYVKRIICESGIDARFKAPNGFGARLTETPEGRHLALTPVQGEVSCNETYPSQKSSIDTLVFPHPDGDIRVTFNEPFYKKETNVDPYQNPS